MKKTTNAHISPLSPIAASFLISGMMFMMLINIYSTTTPDGFDIRWIAVPVAATMYAISLVLNILVIFGKKYKIGDEFTSSVIYKAGFIAFVSLILSLFIFITVVAVMALQREELLALADALSTETALMVVAMIVSAVNLLFTLFVFVPLKRGMKSEASREQI